MRRNGLYVLNVEEPMSVYGHQTGLLKRLLQKMIVFVK